MAIRLGLSVVIAGVFLWIMQAGAMPLVPSAGALRRIKWWALPSYAAMWCTVHCLRAARWQLLLKPIVAIPMRKVLTISFLGYLAILLMPVRTGEIVRPMLIRRQGTISGWAAAGTIGAERIVDGLVLSLLLFVALQLSTPLDPLPTSIGRLPVAVSVVPQGAYVALTVFACALIATVVFYVWKRTAQGILQSVVGVVSPALGAWLSQRVGRLSEGLSFLSQPRNSVPFLAITVAYWVLNAAASWVLALGVGFEEFSLLQGCVITGVLALGILVPNAPGFFGTFQVSLYAGLAMFYSPDRVLGQGAVLVFVMYVGQILVTVGFALIAALLVPNAWRKIESPAN